MAEHLNVTVRDIHMMLTGGNRSLTLCARMNYETENLDFIDRMKSTDILFDLGACEGRFSVYAGLKGIQTYCFEPEERNYQVLNQNIILNNLQTRVAPFNLGISDCKRTGTLHVGQPWAGGHQKIVQHNSVRTDVAEFEAKEIQQISLTSLDHFISSRQEIPFPNYLKVDIDGSELPFINGAKETLANTNLKGVLIELQEDDPSSRQVIEHLERFDFEMSDKFQIPNEPDLYNYLFYRE